MKKAFSLFEAIIVISILAFVFAFILYNYTFSSKSLTQAKIEVALIRASLNEKITKNLLQNKVLTTIDNAQINKENEKLFKYILNEAILSSQKGWIKLSNTSYLLNYDNKKVKFEYKNNHFICLEKNNICKELE
ncbi:type II secretion system protein [Malaciobacter mytili]|uniref:Type II secretion system protein n=1 Tax=Malaciobacter mytili LMG 24559 TaxID=1032238 RepID=A0AAX2AJL2_9BACT|nr:type II secretion system protein [Malaciobacter mytili]AXH14835.1 hypothetical protein AMYT_1252 [Malaciobacter mytili LMG 24559]RXK16795.1 hypothetical protein CP985_01160 [Malaciobacter mytili LMG 24559]